jgi:hypothetical protein
MAVTRQSGSGKVEEFQGQRLSPAIEYAFEWDSCGNVQDVRDSGKWPSDGDILDFVNTKAERSAKAKSYQDATKPLREAYLESPEYKRKTFIASAVSMGMSQAKAEELADSL